MNLHEEFMRDIIANPDDDIPRLIYADWLDERGKTEQAQFIRVQCEIAKYEQRKKGEKKRPAGREEEKLRKIMHKNLIVKRIAHLKVSFQRGMAENIGAHAKTFLEKAECITDEYPTIHRIYLWKVRPYLERILELPLVQQSTTLQLSGDSQGLGNEEVSLVANTAFTRLNSLALRGRWEADMEIMPDGRGWSDEGIVRFAESPAMEKLQHLTLRYGQLGVEGARALIRSAPPELQLLNIQQNLSELLPEADILREEIKTLGKTLRLIVQWEDTQVLTPHSPPSPIQ